MADFTGAPFQYNPAITNVNIDNQLAGILSQFNDDYIMEIIDDSLNNRLRIYDLPMPNIVYSYEMTFKHLTEGFSTNVEDIANTRLRVYGNIINKLCSTHNLVFNYNDDTDYYSAAYWLYDFLISKFTTNMINFYTLYIINERNNLDINLQLSQLRRENDVVYSYSKRLFKDPSLAAIHSNIEYVIEQMNGYSIDLNSILHYVYSESPNLAEYISGLITDVGNFFQNYYSNSILMQSNNPQVDPSDILMYIKLSLQQLGGELENIEN